MRLISFERFRKRCKHRYMSSGIYFCELFGVDKCTEKNCEVLQGCKKPDFECYSCGTEIN